MGVLTIIQRKVGPMHEIVHQCTGYTWLVQKERKNGIVNSRHLKLIYIVYTLPKIWTKECQAEKCQFQVHWLKWYTCFKYLLSKREYVDNAWNCPQL